MSLVYLFWSSNGIGVPVSPDTGTHILLTSTVRMNNTNQDKRERTYYQFILLQDIGNTRQEDNNEGPSRGRGLVPTGVWFNRTPSRRTDNRARITFLPFGYTQELAHAGSVYRHDPPDQSRALALWFSQWQRHTLGRPHPRVKEGTCLERNEKKQKRGQGTLCYYFRRTNHSKYYNFLLFILF